MIFDADTHISPTGEDMNAITYSELLRRMDRAKVDKALVWLRPPYLRETYESNAYVYQAVTNHPDRLTGFGWVDPHFGIDQGIDTIKRCLEEYCFAGVKLNGAQNSFYIDNEVLTFPLIDEIVNHKGMLAFHIGADAIEETHPFRLGKIASRYPETKILAVHMGGVNRPNLTNAMIEVAQEYANIILIGSAVPTNAILKAIRTLGSQRLCFGSDTPFEPMHVEVARYNAMLEGEVSELEKSAIMGGNAAKLLGIKL
jgi:predicted TIM-barrel fold metal-dependent hydrolase